MARLLVEQDRTNGGLGWTATVEYRRYCNCHRILLRAEAADYPERQRQPIEKWDTPKGPKCGAECGDACVPERDN
jgi:hypothetical protein